MREGGAREPMVVVAVVVVMIVVVGWPLPEDVLGRHVCSGHSVARRGFHRRGAGGSRFGNIGV